MEPPAPARGGPFPMARCQDSTQQWCVTAADLAWAETWRPPPGPPRRECIDCHHFIPDAINPPGGLGGCRKRPGLSVFPGVDMRCNRWTQARASPG